MDIARMLLMGKSSMHRTTNYKEVLACTVTIRLSQLLVCYKYMVKNQFAS